MVRLALGVALVAALLSACSPQMAADLAKTPGERCAEGQKEYDADRNLTAGALLFVVCAAQ